MLQDKTIEQIVSAIMYCEPWWSERDEEELRKTIEENMKTIIGKNRIIKMLLDVIDQLEYLDKCRIEEAQQVINLERD